MLSCRGRYSILSVLFYLSNNKCVCMWNLTPFGVWVRFPKRKLSDECRRKVPRIGWPYKSSSKSDPIETWGTINNCARVAGTNQNCPRKIRARGQSTPSFRTWAVCSPWSVLRENHVPSLCGWTYPCIHLMGMAESKSKNSRQQARSQK